MNAFNLKAIVTRPGRIHAALLLATLAGCAPDAINNRQAPGFNGFLNRIAQTCKPLIIGGQDVGQMIQFNQLGDNNYSYFIDQASRLYYSQIAPDTFQQSLVAFFGPGSYNAASFSCIFGNLPANRQASPS